MKHDQVIEDAVENILQYTGVYASFHNGDRDYTIEEITNYTESIREYVRGQLCKVAVEASKNMNLAQLCVARGVTH